MAKKKSSLGEPPPESDIPETVAADKTPPEEELPRKICIFFKDFDNFLEFLNFVAMWTVWTAGSYAVVMLLLGLPLWWKTTAVQRVTLPYHDMASLSDSLQSEFMIKIPINLVGFAKVSPTDETKFHSKSDPLLIELIIDDIS